MYSREIKLYIKKDNNKLQTLYKIPNMLSYIRSRRGWINKALNRYQWQKWEIKHFQIDLGKIKRFRHKKSKKKNVKSISVTTLP